MYPGIVQQQNLANTEEQLRRLLFGKGQEGVWFDPSDLSTMFQDTSGTIPVTADGDPVGLMLDKSGNGNHIQALSDTVRPIYKTDGTHHRLYSSGTQFLSCPTLLPWDGSNFFVGKSLILEGSEQPYAGVYRFLRDGGSAFAPSDNLIEEYSSASDLTRKTLVQRSPRSVVCYNESASRPMGGTPHVSWESNGNTFIQRVAPTQPTPSDQGAQNLTSGLGTLEIMRGYSGHRMIGSIFGFIWVSDAPGIPAILKVEQYLADKAGITLP